MSSAFHERFRLAVSAMTTALEYDEVFARFRIAYEYRRQFRWLEEHQPHRNNQSGLAAALQIALATYIVSEEKPLASEGRNHPTVDSAWVTELQHAVLTTIEERSCLERFEQRLTRAIGDVQTMLPDVLQRHIAAALSNYYDQREMGLTPDLF